MLTVDYLTNEDKKSILQWPEYKLPFLELNYSIKSGGWLDTIGSNTHCLSFSGFKPDLVAFTMLDFTSSLEAEFYIAVKASHLSKGIGRALSIATIDKGFKDLGLERIFLKVRKNHEIGIKLYESIGFQYVKDKDIEVNGIMTSFYLMDVFPETIKSMK